jgi:single-strand DNA-binding protein
MNPFDDDWAALLPELPGRQLGRQPGHKAMLDCLSGRLIRDAELKVGQWGKRYCQFLLSVHVKNEEDSIILSAVAFGDIAERVAKLGKGDSISVVGALKPTEWQDKSTNETRHGLNITVNSLSPYDIQKKRRQPKTETETARQSSQRKLIRLTMNFSSEDYNAGSSLEFIARGVEVCRRCSVDPSYFVKRYLDRDKSIPANDLVSCAFKEILMENMFVQYELEKRFQNQGDNAGNYYTHHPFQYSQISF